LFNPRRKQLLARPPEKSKLHRASNIYVDEFTMW